MVPVKTMREFAPPSSSIYNSTSYQFVSAVGNTVHVWDSRTGRYLERFRVDKREISSMCFDMPRMRRVFLGTESGAIATLNYVTGEVLAVCAAHDREVSGLINMEEWFLFLGRMNQKLSPIESQLLFLHIDKDRDGEITMRELLAIVFQKATAKQLNTMHRHLWDLHLRDATERKQRDIEKLVKKKQKEMFTDVPGHDAADAGA